jgi:DNA-binding NarL/FixJ family response regulator
MKPIRVLLADDHTLVRAGIRQLLERLPGVVVVAETGAGDEALTLAQRQAPDLVLMDIGMAGLNGLEATARLREVAPAIRTIILTMYTTEEYVVQALRAGALGYLLKEAAVEELQAAIQAVMAGSTYVSSSLRPGLEGWLRADATSLPGPLDRLTPRQRDILQRIAQSQTTKEIALRLNLSPKTVEFHRQELMKRLDIHDVPGLVRFALRHGLLAPPR